MISDNLTKLLKPLVYPKPETETIKRQNHIIYNDTYHTYVSYKKKGGTGVRMLSVTQLISKYKPKKTYPTQSAERQYGLTKDEVLLWWRNKNEVANNRGTFIHWLMEKMMLEKVSLDYFIQKYEVPTEIIPFCTYIWNQLQNVPYQNLKTELILFLDEYNIAGQSDVVIIDDKISIHDYKTNTKELHYDEGWGDFFLPPLSHLPCGKLTEYQLQLSIYAYFAEIQYKKPVGDLVIHHLWNEPQSIKVEYLRDEVIALLKHYKSTTNDATTKNTRNKK